MPRRYIDLSGSLCLLEPMVELGGIPVFRLVHLLLWYHCLFAAARGESDRE